MASGIDPASQTLQRVGSPRKDFADCSFSLVPWDGSPEGKEPDYDRNWVSFCGRSRVWWEGIVVGGIGLVTFLLDENSWNY